jgi:hypothetical protein
MNLTNETPVAMLTVGQLKEIFDKKNTGLPLVNEVHEKKYVYGYMGLAQLFSCSIPTAARIKLSGEIDPAIKQIGRKIVIDADLALELAGKKKGGRK